VGFFNSIKKMANQKTDEQQAVSQGLWSNIVGGVTGIVHGFNYKAQENNIALAQINADAARANAEASQGQNSKKYLIAGVAVVVVIVLIVLLKPSK